MSDEPLYVEVSRLLRPNSLGCGGDPYNILRDLEWLQVTVILGSLFGVYIVEFRLFAVSCPTRNGLISQNVFIN